MKAQAKNYNYKIVFGIILGILLTGIGVSAAIKYQSNNIIYDKSNNTLSSEDVQGAIDELATRIVNNPTCSNGYLCFTKKDTLALGDYVYMTPTKSVYMVDSSKTGYTSQAIKLQELNLWRVISVNDDGTVDMISEYVSSEKIYFEGQKGYQNFVGYLNVLASQYENSSYTSGSRHFGYNGQTEYITDTSKFTTTAPWTCSTGESCNPTEKQGGGDVLYQKDYDLVKSVLGTTIGSTVDGSNSEYWMASRCYYYGSLNYYWYNGYYVQQDGSHDGIRGILGNDYSTKLTSNYIKAAIRPIVTLKSGLKYSGSGTKDDPVKLWTS